jgi:hypothetical protein
MCQHSGYLRPVVACGHPWVPVEQFVATEHDCSAAALTSLLDNTYEMLGLHDGSSAWPVAVTKHVRPEIHRTTAMLGRSVAAAYSQSTKPPTICNRL